MPPQNGGHVSCFQPKTDKQVSHSDSDELTPGSSVRWVINVAYLLGTELCVFFAPPPKKKMSTFQNENIHFSSSGLSITPTFIFLLPKEGDISYERWICNWKALDVLASYLHSSMWGFEMRWRKNIAELSWQPSCFAENNCWVEDCMS